jgi:hypothetical protein
LAVELSDCFCDSADSDVWCCLAELDVDIRFPRLVVLPSLWLQWSWRRTVWCDETEGQA